MPLAYHLPRCRRPNDFRKVLEDLDFDHNEGRLIRATLGVYDRARDAELIPNDPRFSWIPALPTKTPDDVLSRFERVLRPGDMASVDDARAVAREHFPPVDRGQAWSAEVSPFLFAVNTHENWYVPEAVKLTVPKRPCDVWVNGSGGTPVLEWEGSGGDRGYHVWRIRDGKEERLTEEPVPITPFPLVDAEGDDWYAVSAITDATETIEGVLHLHQFLLLSRSESRRSPWVNLAGDRKERFRIGECLLGPEPGVPQKEVRCAECTPVEDLLSPVLAEDDPWRCVKRDVMAAMTAWKRAIESEDLTRILACYAPDYREPDGRTTESVEVAFRSVFWRYLKESGGRFAEEWGCVPAWQFPVVRLLVREWHVEGHDRVDVDTVFEMWAGTGPEMEPSDMLKHPCGRGHDMRMSWVKRDGGWLLTRTEPAFLRMEDTFPYRFCYQGW